MMMIGPLLQRPLEGAYPSDRNAANIGRGLTTPCSTTGHRREIPAATQGLS